MLTGAIRLGNCIYRWVSRRGTEIRLCSTTLRITIYNIEFIFIFMHVSLEEGTLLYYAPGKCLTKYVPFQQDTACRRPQAAYLV